MPGFGILAVTSQDVVVLILGEKWSKAGLLLSIFAFRGIPHLVEKTCGWLHSSAGRADRLMRWGIVSTTAHVVALLFGLRFGSLGVVCAYVSCMYLLFVPAIAYAGKPLGIKASDLLRVVGWQMAAALISAGLCLILRHELLADFAKPTRFAILVLSYVLSYLLLVVGVFKVRTPIAVGRSLLREFSPVFVAPMRKLVSVRLPRIG
jgi:PST family polysaccharide transporter